MAGTKVIHVDWEPRSAILAMQQLKPLEELAYRRILDLIYIHGNELIDDDAELGRMTKTGKKWPASSCAPRVPHPYRAGARSW